MMHSKMDKMAIRTAIDTVGKGNLKAFGNATHNSLPGIEFYNHLKADSTTAVHIALCKWGTLLYCRALECIGLSSEASDTLMSTESLYNLADCTAVCRLPRRWANCTPTHTLDLHSPNVSKIARGAF